MAILSELLLRLPKLISVSNRTEFKLSLLKFSLTQYAVSGLSLGELGTAFLTFVIFVLVPGWWKVAPAVVAIAIPWFAVVIANASSQLGTKTDRVTRREIES